MGVLAIWVFGLVAFLLFEQCAALSRDDPEVDRLIRKYWFQYKNIAVILAYLKIVHHVVAGLTWLKKRIHNLGLYRRGPRVQYSSVPDVRAAIESELRGVNSNVGYRQMWSIVKKKYGLIVKRETVQMLMSLLDPDGVERRRQRRLKRRVYQNKGPDFVWHIDGYDKLKPYGFTIHACIDGYSRKIMWLELTSTNNNPRVILLHYLLAVLQNEGVPCICRCDKGTENSILAACQMSLRHDHSDEYKGEKSFRYGPSTTNTRIESWWAQLRNSVTDWWMQLFKEFIQCGIFNPNMDTHRHCLSYVYCEMLEKSLNDFVARWNSHRIRPNRRGACPPGTPDDLHALPQLQGTSSYKKSINYDVWSHCYFEYARNAEAFYPLEFKVAADALLLEHFDMHRSDIDSTNAKPIYLHLLSVFDS